MTGNASAPIWMAALASAHSLNWDWRAGKAVHTNAGPFTERIEPFDILLESGQTVAVCWVPGATNYTVEILEYQISSANSSRESRPV
jgi:hypothetical protein